ncbi:EthD domain-containing protein [Rhizosphaericola mali]|uniref:EthD domain-containing protein n=1 Tax=Rhizosphaericola mali TaxID=2545455 RepID=A0A5P2GCZ1_9BACT|nr:EthD domain-containing protein [Rhizosphaericola mali]QES89461.1 EthD domain-containing protein [Rhizosphaericola mali]
MIKMTMMLKRNPKISHEEFVKHHIEKHGPLFKQIPEAKEHVIRYIQTHPIAQTSSVVKVNDFDGTAELWFDSLEGLETVLTSSFYKENVFPDELTFLDHANTLVTLGYQDDIISSIHEN